MIRRQFLKVAAGTLARGLELFDQQAASMSSASFGSSELSLLRAVLDLIIPADNGLPAVTTVSGIEYLQAIGRGEPSIQEEIRDFLIALNRASQGMFKTAFEDSPEEFRIQTLRDLEKRVPKLFGSFVRYAYEAYYAQPRVVGLIGCDSRPTYATDGDDELLLPVRKMGRKYIEAK
jgi:Gluconate 2-dehydrogenase subunit 3